MTALEKFNEIKGLEKLKENYPLTEFEIKVESVEEFLKISKEDGSNG